MWEDDEIDGQSRLLSCFRNVISPHSVRCDMWNIISGFSVVGTFVDFNCDEHTLSFPLSSVIDIKTVDLPAREYLKVVCGD